MAIFSVRRMGKSFYVREAKNNAYEFFQQNNNFIEVPVVKNTNVFSRIELNYN